jgi:RTX calcium-binding nonapeptide repeat (4 copies)
MATITKNIFGLPISNTNDIINGTSSADKIDGKGSRDTIKAGGGNDVIIGGLGNDLLWGEGGSDTFEFGHLHDADVIYDFGRYDTIDLSGGIDHYFVTEVWNGVRIATVDWDYTADLVQGSIVLHGVTKAEWLSWGGAFGDPNGYSVGSPSSGLLII